MPVQLRNRTRSEIDRNLIDIANSSSFRSRSPPPIRSQNQYCWYFSKYGVCHFEIRTGKRCRFEHRSSSLCSNGVTCKIKNCSYIHPSISDQENYFLDKNQTSNPSNSQPQHFMRPNLRNPPQQHYPYQSQQMQPASRK